MSSSKRYMDSNINSYGDKTSHTTTTGNNAGNSSTQNRNPGMTASHGNKQRSRVTSGSGGKLTVPRPVNLPSKRKESQGNEGNTSHVVAGSAGTTGWHRHEDHPSSSQGVVDQTTTWLQHSNTNRHPSWTGLSHPQVYEEPVQVPSPLCFNQEEYPPLEAATHPKSQLVHIKNTRSDKPHDQGDNSQHQQETILHSETNDNQNFHEQAAGQYQRSTWYDDERQVNRPPGNIGQSAAVENLNHPNTSVHHPHGGFYAPVQMYHGGPGRPMMQPQHYYGHVPYSDGAYHHPHTYYHPVYPHYSHQGYMQGEIFPEQGLYPPNASSTSPAMVHSDGRRNGELLKEGREAEKLDLNQRPRFKDPNADPVKVEEQPQPSAFARFNRGGPFRLIKRQSRGDSQTSRDFDKENPQSSAKEEIPARAESLTVLLRRQKEEKVNELDWDEQVDAEEKKKDQIEETSPAIPATTTAEISLPSETVDLKEEQDEDEGEWTAVKHHSRRMTEEGSPYPLPSNRYFVEQSTHHRRGEAEGGGYQVNRRFAGRGRFQPRGSRGRFQGERNFRPSGNRPYASTSTLPVENQVQRGTKLFPGRGFRPTGPSPRPVGVAEDPARIEQWNPEGGEHLLPNQDQVEGISPHQTPTIKFGQIDSKVEGVFDPFSNPEFHQGGFPREDLGQLHVGPAQMDLVNSSPYHGSVLPDSLVDPTEDLLVSPQADRTPRQRYPNDYRQDGARGGYRGGRGRGRSLIRRFGDFHGGRGQFYAASPSPRRPDFRGRSSHHTNFPRSNGSNYRGSRSPYRGGRQSNLRLHGRDMRETRSASDTPTRGRSDGRFRGRGRGRGDSTSFNRHRFGASSTVSPKVQWIPKRPSQDGEEDE